MDERGEEEGEEEEGVELIVNDKEDDSLS